MQQEEQKHQFGMYNKLYRVESGKIVGRLRAIDERSLAEEKTMTKKDMDITSIINIDKLGGGSSSRCSSCS